MNIDNILSNYNIFLTGGSGFIGCVIIQRLLEISTVNSSNSGQIFLLLRKNKKYGSIEQRLRNQIFAHKIFDHLNKEQIEDLLITQRKVIAIEGELTADLLGIKEKDLIQMKYPLNKKPFIVIHCAADVDFKRDINKLIDVNVNGTFQCIQVAKQINAKAFLHISTLYVNCRLHSETLVMERIYDSGFDAVSVFRQWLACKHITPKQVHILKNRLPKNSSKMTKSWPNSYAVTKNMAEKVALAACNECQLPLSIARLGIVSPIRKGKHCGWFLGNGGFVFIAIGTVTGNLRYLYGDGLGRPDFIPVDYSVNALMAIVSHMVATGIQKTRKTEMKLEEKHSNFDAQNGTVYQIGVIAVDPSWTFSALAEYVTPRWHLKNMPNSPKNAAVYFINNAFLYFCVELILYDIPLFFIWMFIHVMHVFTYDFWYRLWYSFFGLEYYSNLYSVNMYDINGKQQELHSTGVQMRSIHMRLMSYLSNTALVRKLDGLLKGRKKLKWFHNNYSFFVNQRWTFDHSNVKKLYDLLDHESQIKYDFNVDTLDFNDYCLEVSALCYLGWLEYRKKRKIQIQEHCVILRQKLMELQKKSKSEYASKFPTVEQQFLSSFRKLRYLVGIGYQWYFAIAFTAMVGFLIFYF